jgi:hypothetical protein
MPEALPAVAIRQAGLYRLEVALLVFYGWLLLATPAFSGLVRGRLPIEISTRGARFAEGAEYSATLNEEKIANLERVTSDLAEGLRVAQFEIKQLDEARRDKRQPAVGSKE